MAIYTVLAPPSRGGDTRPDPDNAVFVKDGFCWPVLFFAVPWLIYRRMWLVLLLYILAAGAAAFLLGRTNIGDLGGFIVILLVILFALEANNLRRWTLERNGHRFIGLAEGRNLEEAEIRFFSRAEAADVAVTLPPPTPPTPPTPTVPPVPPRMGPVQPSAEAGDVVGLFPAPPTRRPSP